MATRRPCLLENVEDEDLSRVCEVPRRRRQGLAELSVRQACPEQTGESGNLQKSFLMAAVAARCSQLWARWSTGCRSSWLSYSEAAAIYWVPRLRGALLGWCTKTAETREVVALPYLHPTRGLETN